MKWTLLSILLAVGASLAATSVAPKAPAIASVSPSHGPISGGTSITLTGTNFLAVSKVTIWGMDCAFTIQSATSITTSAPPYPGLFGFGEVRVQSPDGEASIPFSYDPPTTLSISPRMGPPTGGNVLTLVGFDYTPDTYLKFGNLAGPPDSVSLDGKSITTKIPAMTNLGRLNIQTCNGLGCTPAWIYEYDAPQILSLSPSHGSVSGATHITLRGKNFTGVTSVKFGDSTGKSLVVVSDSVMTVESPSKTKFDTVVLVANSPSSNNAPAAGIQYAYDGLPVLKSISPSHGPLYGETTVIIRGENLHLVKEVVIADQPAKSLSIDSPTQITATYTPPPITSGSRCSWSVILVIDAGSTQGLSYTIDSPQVTSISATNGPAAGGNTVVLKGANFPRDARVYFGGRQAPHQENLVAEDGTQITAIVPPQGALGVVDVVVEGNCGSSARGLKYSYDPPTIKAISPVQGRIEGWNSVSIRGTNLTGTSSVTFGGVRATSLVVVSDSLVTVVSPASTSSDSVVILLTTPAGTIAGPIFRYLAAPFLTSISPNHGPLVGENNVTITGQNLQNLKSLTIADILTTSFTVDSPDRITAHFAGPGHAEEYSCGGSIFFVSNLDEGSSTYLTYSFDPPTIQRIGPDHGPASGGNTLTIDGTNFPTSSRVIFGDTTLPAELASVNAEGTRITFVAPAMKSLGSVEISVASQCTRSASSLRYRYDPPSIVSVFPPKGPIQGGTLVNITGASFTQATSVRFGKMDAISFQVVSDSLIQAIAPKSGVPESVEVVVGSAAGTSGSSTGDWFVFDTIPGKGTATAPFLISSYEELKLVGTSDHPLDAHYRLADDIDASASKGEFRTSNDQGFPPIGSASQGFTGAFHGAGHRIRNLSIHRPQADGVGMFGYLASNGRVDSLGLEDVQIEGAGHVGAIAGWNEGEIGTSYSTGIIRGTTIAGGLVGQNGDMLPSKGPVRILPGSITNSYSLASITATEKSGGLVGSSVAGTITQCYAAGQVTGIGSGLAGSNSPGSSTGSYWDVQTTGKAANEEDSLVSQALGRTTEQMMTQGTFDGWDFKATWVVYPGHSYPLLQAFLKPISVTAASDTIPYTGKAFTGGNGVAYAVPAGSRIDSTRILGTLRYEGSSQGAIRAGSYSIQPAGLYSNQDGYNIANVPGTLIIAPAEQSISFAPLDTATYGAPDLAPNASSSFGLPVAFSSDDTTIASIRSGGLIHLKAPGEVRVVASQPGTESVLPAPPVSRTLTVVAKTLNVVGAKANSKVYDGAKTTSVVDARLEGVVSGDSVALSGGVANFASTDVGNTIPVTWTGSVLTGDHAWKYLLGALPSLHADILPNTIHVIAKPDSMVVCGRDPVFAYTHSPLIGTDTLAGRLARDTGSKVGEYWIRQGTLTAGANYAIDFTGAVFKILPQPPTSALGPRPLPGKPTTILSAIASGAFAAPSSGSGPGRLGSLSPAEAARGQSVRILLPSAAEVRVAIFDKMGTPVISMDQSISSTDLRRLERTTDGRYVLQVGWNLRSTSGIAVAEGVYLWKIEASTVDRQKLQTIKHLGVKESRR